ncbi:MAG: glutamate-5-semialdehyde dehydrogenase [Rikenellaceae bacterium]|jgi:glutamate-5-semialdehyde dehydrogenase|nr:glutamate-5-semialdehyde dehydrogenase [Rikenellaceae bacterium]
MQAKNQFEAAVAASRRLNLLDDETINRVLLAVADRAEEAVEAILAANAEDLAKMDRNDPMYDRLQLTPERIAGIAGDIRQVVALPSPLGKVLSQTVRPNGMKITKVSVPFGVVGVIYEARPNVSFDVFSLCFKSGNACILKGGTDAHSSNSAIVALIREVLESFNIDPACVTLLPAGREATAELLGAVDFVDVIIPRGSQGLISYVRDNAKVPVIETGAGICHTYFDAEGDLDKGRDIVFNAKTRRPSVCNSLDCLIIHRDRLADLPEIARPLAEKSVLIYADPLAYKALQGNYPAEWLQPATPESFGTEFLSLKMAVKTVDSTDQAIDHVTRYSSKHSEAIVTENPQTAARYEKAIDAACVYVNVSTAFTDGAQFGLGAEIGISTQKLHARGPMGLMELTSYKYLIEGNGQIREK